MPAPKRPERSAETRRRIEVSAAEQFTTRGYGATTMQSIADAAGVHVQTIYLAYRTKAAVLAAAGARLVAGDEDPETHPSQRRWTREIVAEPDPRRKLELYVAHIADVAPRTTRLLDVLRATAPAEAEAADFLEQIESGRREGPRHLLGALVAEGVWRAGLDADQIADIVFTVASQDTLRALVKRCGWSREAAEAWIVATLVRELLPGTEPAAATVP
jgi:AcrR family transcriptional regulator